MTPKTLEMVIKATTAVAALVVIVATGGKAGQDLLDKAKGGQV